MRIGQKQPAAKLLDDARAACDAQLHAAEDEARHLEARFLAEAAKNAEALRERGVREADAHRAQRINAALLQTRLDTLAAQQEMIDRAFALALDKLSRLESGALTALLADLAVAGAKTGREELILSTSDHARYGKRVAEQANALLRDAGKTARLTLSAQPRPLPGGLMLRRDAGVEVNCTFAALLHGLRETLAADVAEILFRAQ